MDTVEKPTVPNRTINWTVIAVGATALVSLTGRFKVEVAGFSVRPEHLATLVLAAVVFARADGRAAGLRALRHPVVLLFGAYLVWGAFSSLLFSPRLTKSAAILGWLGLDWLLLVTLLSVGAAVTVVRRLSGPISFAWAAAGFLTFVIANATKGSARLGTQFEYNHNLYVAVLTAFESNIYATFLLLWTLLFVLGTMKGWRTIAAISIVFPLGLIAAQTRASLAALGAGVALYVAYEAIRQKRSGQRNLALFVAPVALLVGTAVMLGAFKFATGALEQEPAPPPVKTVQVQTPQGTTAVITVPVAPGNTHVNLDKLSATDEQSRGGTLDFRKQILILAAQDMHGANLWFGNGVNTYPLRHDRPAQYGGGTGDLSMLPAQILYDAGIVGVLILSAMFGAVMWRTPPSRRPLAAGILGCFLIASALTSAFWFSPIWMMIAFLMQPSAESEGGPASPPTPESVH
ncbi:hypothetical protein [Smaragdicoccus niigatensis]|uniref:hypothetical protein n=1 Tax=Smaragdicoccus niigatensis TaxID=359359 RepID=UPI0012DE3C3E|nr:hypothetical protein [Smaragdicoccus niigatensis]